MSQVMLADIKISICGNCKTLWIAWSDTFPFYPHDKSGVLQTCNVSNVSNCNTFQPRREHGHNHSGDGLTNPDISYRFYCVGATGHVYCVALVQAPRHIV